MPIYRYVKTTPKIGNHLRLLPISLVIVGLALLMNAALPIFLYQLKSAGFQRQIISPAESYFVDYSNPTNWFPTAPRLSGQESKITDYNISVPKLKIEKAIVRINGNDLSTGLIHYPGTSLPGQYGNAVIFGHSVLPQFFNPKNYNTIFSTIPTLREGDDILVDFDGILYHYQVVKLTEVLPGDVSVLEQRYDGEYLSLVTCVPPGTYLRRLVVQSRLVTP